MARIEVLAQALAGVALWLVDLARPAPTQELACLSTEEQVRAARFRAVRDRDRYLRTHAAMRQLLARHTGRVAHELVYVTGRFGKPSLVGAPACHFNLSHSEDMAVIAISDAAEIGVDVEVLREVPDASALAEQHFTPAERAEYALVPAGQSHRAFLRVWTRKEACLKAAGLGLSLAPSSFEAGLSPGQRQVVLPRSGCALRLVSFEQGGRVIGAVAQRV